MAALGWLTRAVKILAACHAQDPTNALVACDFACALPVEQGHHQKKHRLPARRRRLLTVIEDRRDMRMIDLRADHRLLKKPAPLLGRAPVLGVHRLQRDAAA
ncbi:MAG: hypothetical protein IPK80_34855 [Nannocystis sp.]|nr:hypothetical protein [Nannocystis sp.]